MYLFTYAVDDDNTNELYAEFHLGMVVLYTVYLIHANILYSAHFPDWSSNLESF